MKELRIAGVMYLREDLDLVSSGEVIFRKE